MLVTIFVVLGTSIIVGFLVARSHGSNRRPVALDPENYVALKLAERRELSHDTRLFRFSLQTPLHILGLPIGQHISMRFVDADSKPVSRSYTPTSSDEDIGHVDFVVKVCMLCSTFSRAYIFLAFIDCISDGSVTLSRYTLQIRTPISQQAGKCHSIWRISRLGSIWTCVAPKGICSTW